MNSACSFSDDFKRPKNKPTLDGERQQQNKIKALEPQKSLQGI